MAEPKLTPNQLRRIEELEGFLHSVALVRKLVTELESNRAARPQLLEDISNRISRELTKVRQRAMTANVGTLADVAGSLATMSKRSQGLLMKIRGLKDGVASLEFQLDRALAQAKMPEERGSGTHHPPTE